MDWYAWNIKAYRADTAHLTTLQHGAYRLLIDHYMDTRVPLLDNDLALAKIAGLTAEEWASMSMTIRAFFRPEGGRLHHKHCDAELNEQDGGTKRASKHARHAANERWRIERERKAKMLAASNEHTASTIPELPEQCSPLPHDATGEDRTREEKKNTGNTESLNGTDAHRADARLSAEVKTEFETTFWPACWIKSGRKPALKAFAKARQRASLEDIMAGVKRYVAILAGPDPPKPKWPQGWLNDDRWTDLLERKQDTPTTKPLSESDANWVRAGLR